MFFSVFLCSSLFFSLPLIFKINPFPNFISVFSFASAVAGLELSGVRVITVAELPHNICLYSYLIVLIILIDHFIIVFYLDNSQLYTCLRPFGPHRDCCTIFGFY